MTRTAGTLILMIAGLATAAEPPIKPTLVSWDGKEAPAVVVIDSIAKQAGIAIDHTVVPADRKWKPELTNRPVWIALDEFSQSINARIVVVGKGERIRFVKKAFQVH